MAKRTSSSRFRTKNGLSRATRDAMVELLNARLADAIDLQLQAKQAHWNVKGPHFIALHELFDKVAEGVEGYVDMLAERVSQLGGVALGTADVVAKRSALKAYPTDIFEGRAHVDALSTALAAFGSTIREAIDAADKRDDAGTADLFTEISRGVDTWLWFVEAHQQA
jgi:starvation-inducible DNA-binding protein